MVTPAQQAFKLGSLTTQERQDQMKKNVLEGLLKLAAAKNPEAFAGGRNPLEGGGAQAPGNTGRRKANNRRLGGSSAGRDLLGPDTRPDRGMGTMGPGGPQGAIVSGPPGTTWQGDSLQGNAPDPRQEVANAVAAGRAKGSKINEIQREILDLGKADIDYWREQEGKIGEEMEGAFTPDAKAAVQKRVDEAVKRGADARATQMGLLQKIAGKEGAFGEGEKKGGKMVQTADGTWTNEATQERVAGLGLDKKPAVAEAPATTGTGAEELAKLKAEGAGAGAPAEAQAPVAPEAKKPPAEGFQVRGEGGEVVGEKITTKAPKAMMALTDQFGRGLKRAARAITPGGKKTGTEAEARAGRKADVERRAVVESFASGKAGGKQVLANTVAKEKKNEGVKVSEKSGKTQGVLKGSQALPNAKLVLQGWAQDTKGKGGVATATATSHAGKADKDAMRDFGAIWKDFESGKINRLEAKQLAQEAREKHKALDKYVGGGVSQRGGREKAIAQNATIYMNTLLSAIGERASGAMSRAEMKSTLK